MTDNKTAAPLAFDEDAITNTSANRHFSDVLQVRLSRRQALVGGMSASAAFLLGGSLAGCSVGDDDDAPAPASPFSASVGFTAIPKSLADAVSLASGYSASVLYALGDPLDNATSAWSDAGTETGASYEKRSGDHHDGMSWFGMTAAGAWDDSRSDRGLLCINHENITRIFLHADTTALASPRPEDAALKEINAHGVGIVEVAKNGAGTFEVNRASPRNRRITPNTPAELHGAVRGSRFTVTRYSTGGTMTRGTINNCANGKTPWGTYLTCEENWAGYFKRAAGDDTHVQRTAAEVTLLKRYGINQGAGGNNAWATVTPADSASTVFSRWDASIVGASAADDFRNEPNTFGWVVEIDPFAPAANPRKRTALGRLAHENAEFGKLVAGQPVVVYTGDDSRFEYIYKFVSDALWDPADATGGLAAGDKYLNNGTLYVARFNADGTGEWLALEHQSNGLGEDNVTFPFTSQAAVLVATRLAADVAGATKMDRPEWIAVNPRNGEVYCTLTNNSNRAQGANPGVDAANPRNYTDLRGATTQRGNVNGHIIRWREDNRRNDALTFAWDIYVFGAQADADPALVNVSGLTTDNDMSSPDGLWFDPRGILWIQTDDGAYVDVSNCMMLAAVPGEVGDGASVAIGAQATHVGKAPGTRLRRFLVGPKECEITGVTMTPDGRTMFVNIQHPGEDTASGNLATPAGYSSHWPYTADATVIDATLKRPRSATIVITKDNGGVIGS
ncbi:MAG: PhoX family phosphatase [Moraxellaceae bacterium]|nr:PhoX family phosphatase [Moraxellaceae bacterium]